MRPAPIESENLGLRYEGWRLVLKSLDSRWSGLGLVVTGDAGSQYHFWPESRGPQPMCFGILVLEQVVNVALSKRRFQIYIAWTRS